MGVLQEGENWDRPNIALPGLQAQLARAVAAANPSATVVCVLVHGGVLDLAPVTPSPGPCDAILSAGFPGMQGGPAIMDALMGAYSPAGRTPLTWYTAEQVRGSGGISHVILATRQYTHWLQAAALPDPGLLDMYAGTGRTYRFYDAARHGQPQYAFGHGACRHDYISAVKITQCVCRPILHHLRLHRPGRLARRPPAPVLQRGGAGHAHQHGQLYVR